MIKIQLRHILLFLPLLLALSIVLSSCRTLKPVRTTLQSPVLFVSGFGSKQSLWKDEGMVAFLEAKGYHHGGRVFADLDKNKGRLEDKPDANLDFFVASFTDSTASIETNTSQLELMINEVLSYTRAEKLVLVGYSMGGIICRNYLRRNIDKHNAEALITISTPHQGSYLANVALAGRLLSGRSEAEMAKGFEKMTGVPVTGEAIKQLIILEDGFLTNLNEAKHPPGVKYYSVIARSSLSNWMNDWKGLLGLVKISPYEGDFVASVESQDMSKLDCFQNEAIDGMGATTIDGANHFDVLKRHEEIYAVLEQFIRVRRLR